MAKIKVKIGMVRITSQDDKNSYGVRFCRIIEEFDDSYLVEWGQLISGDYDTIPRTMLVNKTRVYNIREKEVSRFKIWWFKYW